MESGQPLDDNLLKQLDILSSDSADRFDRGLIITALWLLPVSVGLVAFAFVLGTINDQARVALLVYLHCWQ